MGNPVIDHGSQRFETLLMRIGNHHDLIAAYGEACRPEIEDAIRARLNGAGIEPQAFSIDEDVIPVSLSDVECAGNREAIHAFDHQLGAAIAREPIDVRGGRAYLHIFMNAFSAPAPSTCVDTQEAHLGPHPLLVDAGSEAQGSAVTQTARLPAASADANIHPPRPTFNALRVTPPITRVRPAFREPAPRPGVP